MACARRQRLRAQIRIADGVQHQAVRRQRLGDVMIIGVNDRDGENTVIHPGAQPHIAAARSGQEQHVKAGFNAAIMAVDEGVPGKSQVPMQPCGIVLAEQGQDAGHALVGRGACGVLCQGALIMAARGRQVAILQRHVTERDAGREVIRMVIGGLLKGRSGGGAVAVCEGKQADFIQCETVRVVDPQDFEIEALRGLIVTSGGAIPRAAQHRLDDGGLMSGEG